MHPEQQIFCLQVKQQFFPHYEPFNKAKVLDCGSLDINGNNRFLFLDCDYTGIDIQKGRNVDVVCAIHEWKAHNGTYDTIICTEVLEHDEHWRDSLLNMMRMLKPGGLMIITCATADRGAHSMFKEGPPLADEYYENLSEAHIRTVWDVETVFERYVFHVGRENRDLYFWGVKR